jgi:GTP pyrophosphokinase
MQAKKVDFGDIYDIFAVRIVFEPKSNIDVKKQCWDIYSAITDLYKLRPDRIRDWVSRPKANGYQALHLTVMGPDGQWIEIQIRSTKMDEIAEKGFAAHWKYKERGDSTQIEEETELDRWLECIQDILEAPSPNAMDFLDTIKMNLYASEIFVFTPKGEIKTLPQGATALDFGYEIHTNVGDHCIGAKVNHRLVPLSHKLNSGDQVEILTSRSQSPHTEWLNFVTTAKAKTKIESCLKKWKKEKIKEGEQMLEDIIRKANIETSVHVLDKLLSYYGYPKKEDFYFAIAEKKVELSSENIKKVIKEKSSNYFVKIVKQAITGSSSSKENAENKLLETPLIDASKINRKKTYILEEENFQKNYIAASCCNPIPGDDVLGFISDDNRLEVHKRSCTEALMLKIRFGDRIISCDWAGHKAFSFPGTINVEGFDRIGILSEIAQIIANDLSVNVRKLNIATNDGLFGGTIEVAIHDVKDINLLINSLQRIKGVKNVKRID